MDNIHIFVLIIFLTSIIFIGIHFDFTGHLQRVKISGIYLNRRREESNKLMKAWQIPVKDDIIEISEMNIKIKVILSELSYSLIIALVLTISAFVIYKSLIN